MNVIKISGEDNRVTTLLSVDELRKICNIMYKANEDEKNALYFKLYGELIVARDMCQYGHLDNFSLECVTKCMYSEKQIREAKR